MRKATSIKIKMYFPTTDTGKQKLARRVSEVHADFVSAQVKSLNCPAKQKLALVDSVITAKRLSGGQ